MATIAWLLDNLLILAVLALLTALVFMLLTLRRIMTMTHFPPNDDRLIRLVGRIADRLERLGRKPFILDNPNNADDQRRADAIRDHAARSELMRRWM